MYLYTAFFSEQDLARKRFYISGKYAEAVRLISGNLEDLNLVEIEACIGFLKGKDNVDKKCFVLNVRDFKVDDNCISFNFDLGKELDVTSGFIDKSLYKFARQSNWISTENKYYPLLCIFEKPDFDIIRKGSPNIRKLSSNSAKIDEFKEQNNWSGICEMFEPLEKISDKEIWSNSSDLYNLAFACSKQGEPQNGMEKDKNHLAKVKRYRELSITFFNRCCELEPNDSRYRSALAYRHYQNVMELTKAKGRRDGNPSSEIAEAILNFDKALKISPSSIKVNYRKGKLILEKMAETFKFSRKEWTADTFKELEEIEDQGIACLEKVIKQYETLTSDVEKKRYSNEFIKAMYCLGCYYLEKPKVKWMEYACCKMQGLRFENSISRQDVDSILKAKEILERCFQSETDTSLEEELDYSQLSRLAEKWTISPVDKLYRLGSVYLELYFIEITTNNGQVKNDTYGPKAEKYLNVARKIGDELKRTYARGRNTWFISDKLAWYYMLSGDYGKATRLIEYSRESYIKNTYAVCLLLSNFPNRFSKAEIALNGAASDPYFMAKDISVALLGHLYSLSGETEKLKSLLDKKGALKGSGRRLLALLEK